uniref:Uncharacterized protein n=1 Tax=Romanomermis culicivorax TaxID=13658 RepID=A0A915K5D0_ROMCU
FSDYGGGPVKLQEQLDTSFKFSGCWVNADHPSMKPALKWRQLRGLIDPNKLKQNFGTSDGPEYDVILIRGEKIATSSSTALV